MSKSPAALLSLSLSLPLLAACSVETVVQAPQEARPGHTVDLGEEGDAPQAADDGSEGVLDAVAEFVVVPTGLRGELVGGAELCSELQCVGAQAEGRLLLPLAEDAVISSQAEGYVDTAWVVDTLQADQVLALTQLSLDEVAAMRDALGVGTLPGTGVVLVQTEGQAAPAVDLRTKDGQPAGNGPLYLDAWGLPADGPSAGGYAVFVNVQPGQHALAVGSGPQPCRQGDDPTMWADAFVEADEAMVLPAFSC